MPILSAQNLGLSFLDKTIFSGANFDIEPGERVGLIGVNGCGKTSLFRIINGELEATEGVVVTARDTVIGNVEQHSCRNPEITAYEEVLTVYNDVAAMGLELDNLRKKLENCPEPELSALIARQDELTEKFQNRDGLTYKSRSRSALLGLGFSDDEINLKVKALSGGQKTKVALAKLLLCGADLILLDEPTNHLDLKSVEWLEDFLKKYRGTAVIISHDRYFLDRVAGKIIEIEHGRVTATKGNYTRFMQLKAERVEFQRREYEKTTKEISRIEGIIAQQKTFSQERNYITIASKQKQIDRLSEGLVAPDKELAEIKLSFPVSEESGNDVLFVEGVAKSFKGTPLFSGVDMEVYKGERVFLLGPNGCGKSTLLKILMGMLSSDCGRVRFGHGVKVGYFEQVQQTVTSEKTVLDEVYDRFPRMTVTEVRNALAAFLFRGEDVYKKMCELSGGERAKVALLQIMLKGSNVLLLDEPTNHLDSASAENLEKALAEYEGTIICVSHDRYLINRLATKIYYFSDGGFAKIDGNYDTYRELTENVPAEEKPEKVQKVNDYKLKKEQASLERKRQTRIKKIEEEIAGIDGRREEISALLLTPEVTSDYVKIAELTQELEALDAKEEELMAQWEELSD